MTTMTPNRTLKVKGGWPIAVTAAAVVLVAVFLTWRYVNRCNAWEAKVREQTANQFYPAYRDVYPHKEIVALARRALDHERPEGC